MPMPVSCSELQMPCANMGAARVRDTASESEVSRAVGAGILMVRQKYPDWLYLWTQLILMV